ncbi:two-pore potassium channel 4-like [Prunus avium]|uniref:Two-pore potassium channel 4-like n=1 Tax=Prunus avium TaxID=42229 RepID=A0A6P5RUC7_PRUAV|nr:two-pore potassium channel 4-like [Prunus avium]
MEIREDIGDQSSGGGSGVNLHMPLLDPSTLGSGVGGDLPHSPPAPDHIQPAPNHIQTALEHLRVALEHIEAAHEHIQGAVLLQQDVAQDATLLPQDIPGPAPPTRLQVVIRISMWPLMLGMIFGLLSCFLHSFVDKNEKRSLSPFAFSLSLTAQTMSTVGYGDIVPDSVWGKVLTLLLSFFLSGVWCYVGDLFLMTLCDCFIKLVELMLVDRCISEHKFNSFVGWLELLAPLFAPILCVVIGMLEFHRLTEFNYLDCLYLSVVTITTLGYGDIVIKSEDAVIFASFWIWLSTMIYAKCTYYISYRLARRLGIV